MNGWGASICCFAGLVLVLGPVGCDDKAATPEPAPASAAEPEPEPDEPKPVETQPEETQPEAARGVAGVVAVQVAAAQRAEPETTPVQTPPAVTLVPPPEEPPKGLAAPTEAEFKAWDRKDPAAEALLSAWDTANLDAMLGYVRDVECFKFANEAAGAAYRGKSGAEADWLDYKRKAVPGMDRWQQRMFADNPEMIEKSKFAGMLLELHELVMNTQIKAYNDDDQDALDKFDLQWEVVSAKITKYTDSLGGKFERATASGCAPVDRD